MGKFMDTMRKLGIFRSGAVAAKYTSGKDRPIEFQMDNVYNAKKDLINKDDVAGVKKAVVSQAQPNPQKLSAGRKILFWVMLAIGFIYLVIFISNGFSLRLVINILLWIVFIYLLFRFAFKGAIAWWLMIVITVIIFIFSLVIYPSSDESSSSSSSTSGNELQQYDQKIYEIYGEGGKVKGVVGIKVKENNKKKKYLATTYHILIKDPLPKNGTCNNEKCSDGKPHGYTYIGNILQPKSDPTSDSVGAYSPAYCNKTAISTDYFESDSSLYQCSKPVTNEDSTDTFSANFARNYYSLEEFLATTTYEVYDASLAWLPGEEKDTTFVDDALAVSQGKKVKTYTYTYTEKK